MRKHILTILILTTWAAFSTAQNLVPNPSFEIHDTCPDNQGQIYYALPWTDPTNASTDYYHSCCTTSGWFGVPLNINGAQLAKHGQGYVGLVMGVYGGSDYREYMQVQLTNSLILNSCYRLIFYVNMADPNKYGVTNFGAYFSSTPVTTCVGCVMPFTPQINYYDPLGISDKYMWYKVESTFIASGGEQYLTIGNFLTDSATTFVVINSTGPSSYAYYNIDSVTLALCTPAGIQENASNTSFNIYPNPTNESATLEFNNPTKQNCTLTLYDLRGQVVQTTKNITTDKVEIERQNLTSGLYFFQLRTDKQIIATGKLTIE